MTARESLFPSGIEGTVVVVLDDETTFELVEANVGTLIVAYERGR